MFSGLSKFILTSCLMFGPQLVAVEARAIFGGKEISGQNEIENLIQASTFKIFTEPKRSYCSAVLVDSNRLLTAAHCFDFKEGSAQIYFPNKIVASTSIEIGKDRANDYAIISFSSDPTLEGLHPISLIFKNIEELKQNDRILIAGFGTSSTDPFSQEGIGVLRYANISFHFVTPYWIIFSQQDQGACSGDSGGPVFIVTKGRLSLIGVTIQAGQSWESCTGFSYIFPAYKVL